MVRAVCDANVLVAGLPATRGTLCSLVNHWRAGHFQLAVSSPLLAEVARTWTKPYWCERMAPEQREGLLELLEEETERVSLRVAVQGVATHPEDDLILATAVSAQADYLVTGDKQLLALGAFQGVRIVAPTAFLAILENP